VNRVIWTYWNDKNIPDLVLRCLNSIKRQNKDYSVITLHEDDIPDEVYKVFSPESVSQGKKKLNDVSDHYHQHLSDILRIWLLKEYGGVWLDISTYCNAPIDVSLEGGYDFYAEYHDPSVYEATKEIPYFECILMSSNPNGKIINRWWEECKFLWTFDYPLKYIDYLTNIQKVNLDGIHHFNSYLWPCLALRSVLTKNPNLVQHIKKKPLSEGYYFLPDSCDWDCAKMYKTYDEKKHKIVKLTHTLRSDLQIQKMILESDSKYDNK